MENPFRSVVGQDKAVEQLRAAAVNPVHAYLFVGPAGSGKRAAARAFAALLLNDERPLRDLHPDVVSVEREGASINVAQAREIGRLAARSPMEGNRKVLILHEFHLVEEAAPALLKTIEEASPSTIFVILADTMTRDLVTVASRCVRIEFSSLSPQLIQATLLAEGVEAGRAEIAANASFGNLERARLLAIDDAVVVRRELWANAPSRLDGTGYAAALLTEEVVASLDHACEPLLERQAQEVVALKEAAKETGVKVTPAKELETRQKREVRRLRTDELRAGLATLSQELGRYVTGAADARSSLAAREALKSVDWANDALQFNANEALLLNGLFMRLSDQGAIRLVKAG